jgi:hypothetical protein
MIAGLVSLPSASALPPGGTDVFNVSAQVDVESRFGFETVGLSGTAVLERSDPYLDGDVEVSDIELTSLDLTGNSLIGPLSTSESASKASMGELRSLQPDAQFPASSYIDAYIVSVLPSNPSPTLTLHNEQPLRLRPGPNGTEGALSDWPPVGVTYALEPIFGVDDDGDTLIDEDTPDEDGDGLYDEDRPGPDPDTPGSGHECRDNADCDEEEGEDPPADLCPPASQGTPTLCDPDGDGLIDEDPRCIPLLNTGNTHLKAGVCIRDVYITIVSSKTPTAAPTETATDEPPATPTITPVPPTPNGTQTATPTVEPPTPTAKVTQTVTPTPTAPPTATDPPPAPTPLGIVGDANCSGSVTAVDAALVLQLSAGLVELLGCEQLADVDLDGLANAVDAALIVQFIAHLVSNLPPQPAP